MKSIYADMAAAKHMETSNAMDQVSTRIIRDMEDIIKCYIVGRRGSLGGRPSICHTLWGGYRTLVEEKQKG